MADSDYWSLDIPGLGEEEALLIRDQLHDQFAAGVTAVDPKTLMVRGYDLATVGLLVTCLRAGIESGTLEGADDAVARSLLEDCMAWLVHATRD